MSHARVKAWTAAVAMMLVATACSKKEPEAPAAAPETAAAPAESSAAAPAPEATAAATVASEAGSSAYGMYCVACHGKTGKGDGAAAASMNPKPADLSAGAFKYDANGNGIKGEIDDIKAIVHDGAAKHGGSPLMAPWPMLSADQLQAVAEYVKSLHAG